MNQELIIPTPRFLPTPRGTRVEISLSTPRGPFELFFEIIGSAVAQDATACVAGLLPLAMKNHWNIVSHAPVSERLLNTMPAIHNIYRLWDASMGRIHVTAPKSINPGVECRQVGSFFSGGVDSWYTAVKNTQTVNNLIFITGFDIPLSNQALGKCVLDQIRLSAEEAGRQLIEVKTNLREFSDLFLSWGMYHGAALAAVALWLAPRLQRVLIPSTHHYGDIFPWGSHPLLDPLWSTEAVQIATDGCEATRFMKTCLIAENPVAIRRLRVCYNNRNKHYNCGRCEKCLRTKVALYALGVLHQCDTMDQKIQPSRFSKIRLGDHSVVGNFTRSAYIKDNLEALQRAGRDYPALTRALQKTLRKPGLTHYLRRKSRVLFHHATWKKLLTSIKIPTQHSSNRPFPQPM